MRPGSYYWFQSPFVPVGGEDPSPAIAAYGRPAALTLPVGFLGRTHFMASQANLFVGAEDDRPRLSTLCERRKS